MNDAIQEATNAFDAAMGNTPARSNNGGGVAQKSKPEVLFEEPGFFEDTGEAAGGDHLPNPAKSKKTPVVLEEDEDERDDTGDLEGEDDEESDADDEGDEDGDSGAKRKAGKEEDDEEDEDALLSQEFEVQVDGEPKTVKLREALDGYIRNETFHQRLNQVEEARKVVRTEAIRVVDDRKKYIGLLDEAQALMDAMVPAEPDWDKLFAENPAEARALQKQYDGFKVKVDEIKSAKAKALRDAKEQADRDLVSYIEEEMPKFVAAAKWKNAEDKAKDLKSMRRTALNSGFTEQEVSEVYDSRMLLVLLKASKYDRMMAAKPKPVNKHGRKPANLGAGSDRTAPKGMSRAQQRLNRTGSIEDAANVFAQIIK